MLPKVGWISAQKVIHQEDSLLSEHKKWESRLYIETPWFKQVGE